MPVIYTTPTTSNNLKKWTQDDYKSIPFSTHNFSETPIIQQDNYQQDQ